MPQAWVATSIFGLLAGCLGLELAHDENQICFRDPELPDCVDHPTIHNLGLGDSRLDLRLNRYGNDVTLNILSRRGNARVMLLK